MRKLKEIAELLETNEAASVGRMMETTLAREPDSGIRVRCLGRARLIDGGGVDVFSRAFGMGFDGLVEAEQIAEVSAFYEEVGEVPRVDLNPFADPSLRKELRKAGYGPLLFVDVLVRGLAPGADLTVHLPDIRIERPDPGDVEAMAAAGQLIARGFDGGSDPSAETLAITERMMGAPDAVTFVAYLSGEPAGGGSLAVYGETAALFGASTLPRARRQGVQAALILARLAHARDHGASLASILAEPGISTRRNAERLGFQLVYTKLRCAREPRAGS